MPIHEHTGSESAGNPRDERGGCARTAIRSGGLFVSFLGFSCLGLAIVVILLARQNRSLRAQLDRAPQHSSAAGGADRPAQRPDAMTVGDHLQPVTTFGPPTDGNGPTSNNLQSSDGSPLPRFADAPMATLLFLFAGECDACDEMDPVVARLAQAGSGLGVAVVGVQVDAAKPADIKHTGRGFLVCGVAVADRRGTWIERVVTVPGLALVDRSGTVRSVWWGVIDDAQELEVRKEMERFAESQEQRPAH